MAVTIRPRTDELPAGSRVTESTTRQRNYRGAHPVASLSHPLFIVDGMATQLRLLENQSAEVPVDPRPDRSRSASVPLREPLDAGTRERGLRGIAAARQALRDAGRRAAIRDAERRRAQRAQLVDLAGRASAIAASPTGSVPDTPHLPDGNAAA